MATLKSIFDLKNFIITFFCLVAFSCLFLYEATAEVRNLIDGFDYSSLSAIEIQQEIRLLNKYARRAYADNDFELSKLLFYQILEFDPKHPDANKYLDYYIPKKISESKHDKGRGQRVALDKKGKDVTGEQPVDLDDIEKEAISSGRHNRIKEKYYNSELDRIAKEAKQKRGFELKQIKKEEAIRKKQFAMEKKEQVRRQGEKQLAAKKNMQLIQQEKSREDAALRGDLNKLVREEERERRLTLNQKNKYETQRRDQLVINEDDEEFSIFKGEISQEPITEKRKETKMAKKKSVKTDSRDELIKKIVEDEIASIQSNEKRLAKEEVLRKKTRAARVKKEMARLKRQEKAQRRDSKPLIKLNDKASKKQSESKSQAQDTIIDKGAIEANPEKHISESKMFEELSLGSKDNIPGHSDQVVQDKTELSTQAPEKPKEKEQELAQKKIDRVSALQKDSWNKIKALYKEGIDSYRVGEYEKAMESFAKILAKIDVQ